MNRPRRNCSYLLGAIGFAALALPFPSAAQEVDDRPIYYVMLKSLEDGFQAYTQALAADLETRDARLQSDYESQRRAIEEALATLEAERERRESEFNSTRTVLNERVADINEQIALRDGRASEERRIAKRHSARYANDPRIKSLKERIAAQLAEIGALRNAYTSQLAATQKARATLARQFEEYMTAGDPLALEIRSLDRDWQRFAEEERRKLKALADAYAVDYAAYEKWLDDESANLRAAGSAVEAAARMDREQRALHEKIQRQLQAAIDEYNVLVEVHTSAGPDDPGRDGRALTFAALEARIDEFQEELARVREAVVTNNEELTRSNHDFTERYRRFADEKRKRDATLAADLAEIDAARLSIESDIDARRQEVDTQIKTLEANISSELEDSRSNLETLNMRLVEDFGRDHEGLDSAITRALDGNDDGLLYTAAGAPRFDLSRPMTAAVYTAVERVNADRRELDARIVAIENSEGGSQSGTSQQPAAHSVLDREHAALNAERQQLLEAHAAFARDYQVRAAALEQRARIADTRLREARTELGQLYTARAALTRSEMQAVQRVLVDSVKGIPATAPAASDHAELASALRGRARASGEPADESLQAPHALLDRIASGLPPQAGTHGGWQRSAAHTVTSSRELGGADKAALASAWLARFRRQTQFADTADRLDASGAVADGARALGHLFTAGVLQHTTVTEQRLDDGGTGIQVNVLGRAYQLDSAGSLEPLSDG